MRPPIRMEDNRRPRRSGDAPSLAEMIPPADTNGPPRSQWPGEEPSPRSTHVSHLDGTTAIVRTWPPADAARCHRCPECSYDATYHFCLVHVPGRIDPAEAPLFRLTPPPGSNGRLG